jgi:DNA gyrase subunit B/topoisomerase-4 subunit B
MPALIAGGKVYLAQPPLYRIDVGKETHWALDERHKEDILKRVGSKGKIEITRFKGLGEMMPKVLWETTLNPRTRRLLRVGISDQIVTDRVINELMGKDPSARFRFIMDRAEQAEELDV